MAAKVTSRPARLAGINDSARYAGVSPRTIRRYISAGRLKGYRFGPRLVKVDLDEIDAITTVIPTVGSASCA